MNGSLARWWEKLGIAAVVGVVGALSLGSSLEDWRAPAPQLAAAAAHRCIALQGATVAPRCATVATAATAIATD